MTERETEILKNLQETHLPMGSELIGKLFSHWAPSQFANIVSLDSKYLLVTQRNAEGQTSRTYFQPLRRENGYIFAHATTTTLRSDTNNTPYEMNIVQYGEGNDFQRLSFTPLNPKTHITYTMQRGIGEFSYNCYGGVYASSILYKNDKFQIGRSDDGSLAVNHYDRSRRGGIGITVTPDEERETLLLQEARKSPAGVVVYNRIRVPYVLDGARMRETYLTPALLADFTHASAEDDMTWQVSMSRLLGVQWRGSFANYKIK